VSNECKKSRVRESIDLPASIAVVSGHAANQQNFDVDEKISLEQTQEDVDVKSESTRRDTIRFCLDVVTRQAKKDIREECGQDRSFRPLLKHATHPKLRIE
jgi:hypothetical protein